MSYPEKTCRSGYLGLEAGEERFPVAAREHRPAPEINRIAPRCAQEDRPSGIRVDAIARLIPYGTSKTLAPPMLQIRAELR